MSGGRQLRHEISEQFLSRQIVVGVVCTINKILVDLHCVEVGSRTDIT